MNYPEYVLPGIARGYKQPGKKMRPRDAYIASTGDTVRAFRRWEATEVASYGTNPYQSSAERTAHRKLRHLSTRARKVVEAHLNEDFRKPLRGRKQVRALHACDMANDVAELIAVDDAMWRNAQ